MAPMAKKPLKGLYDADISKCKHFKWGPGIIIRKFPNVQNEV